MKQKMNYRMTLYMTDEFKDRLENFAQKHSLTNSQAMKVCVSRFLDWQEKKM